MCVDPAHHRRGAGTLLMQYGVEIADRLGFPVRIRRMQCISHTTNNSKAVVEASRMGWHLYNKFGFQILEDVLIANPPKQQGQQEQFIYWMRRPEKPTVF